MVLNPLFYIKKIWGHRAIVLMYHRVADSPADVWDIAVSPKNLEAHLRLLKQSGRVIPLQKLAKEVRNKWIRKDSIAITFDDGYADNFTVAKPLLEKYNLPATFFITTVNIGMPHEFWWDELEKIILYTKTLPADIEIKIADKVINFKLNDETTLNDDIVAKHIAWKAYENPPATTRCNLFLTIWELLQPLDHDRQQHYLTIIRQWAGCHISARHEYQCMTLDQLKQLSQSKLFSIQAHTTTHAALSYHDTNFQSKEMLDNKKFLEKNIGKKIETIAYPYGNYNIDTPGVAVSCGFKTAFTTDEESVTNNTGKYRIGRFQVRNQDAITFEKNLSRWISM